MEYLDHFFSATFHNDWPLDYRSYQEAVRDYARRAGPDWTRRVAGELAQLLEEEDIAVDVICDFGGDFLPLNEPIRGVLNEILSVLRDAHAT